jgi:hypothetical protein
MRTKCNQLLHRLRMLLIKKLMVKDTHKPHFSCCNKLIPKSHQLTFNSNDLLHMICNKNLIMKGYCLKANQIKTKDACLRSYKGKTKIVCKFNSVWNINNSNMMRSLLRRKFRLKKT